MADGWMSEPYEPENEVDRMFSTDESWRGDRHATEDESWRSGQGEWDDDLYIDEEDPDAWQWDDDPGQDTEPGLFRERNEDDPTA